MMRVTSPSLRPLLAAGLLGSAPYFEDFLLAEAGRGPVLPCHCCIGGGGAPVRIHDCSQETFWRGRPSRPVFGGVHSKQLARSVAALGLLEERGQLPRHTPRRVQRLLDLDRLEDLRLPELVLLCQGLQGLGLSSLLEQARRLQSERLTAQGGSVKLFRMAPGAGSPKALELCEAFQLLEISGRPSLRLRSSVFQVSRLSPEPSVFDMIRLAANHVDRLKRGERHLLQEMRLGALSLSGALRLGSLAKQLGFEPGSRLTQGQHAAGSREAALCTLARWGEARAELCCLRFNWFERKSRAQVSWFRNRGHLW